MTVFVLCLVGLFALIFGEGILDTVRRRKRRFKHFPHDKEETYWPW